MTELKQIAKSYKMTRLALIITAILTGATVIAQAYFIVTIVDEVFVQGSAFTELIPLFGWLLAALIGRVVLTHINGLLGVKMAASAKAKLRKTLIDRLAAKPLQASMKGQSGRKVSVLMDSVDEVDSYFSKYIPQVIQTSVIPLMILIAVFQAHIYTALIMIITAPFIPLFYVIIGLKTKQKSEEQMDKLAAFSGRFLDTLQGLTTLKLFGQAKKQKETIRESSTGFREATMDVLKIAFISSLMLEFISMLGIGLIALEVGLRLIIFESITFHAAFFVLVLAPEFYMSLKDLGSAFHTGRGSLGAAKKITDELKEESGKVNWGDAQMKSDEVPPQIELQQFEVTYGEGGFTLQDINTTIKPYEKVAIIGRSGSGKTTLLHAIAGLLPRTAGVILIDGLSQSKYKESQWFDQVSYISQNPYLFAGTIAENIAIGTSGEVTRNDIVEACDKAGLTELINELENGYDTEVGEAGRGLSGGEKQRLAIARAFLKQPKIILFDEPTTGLDLKTERILQASIEELSKTSTVITVAHRLHTIRHADRIILLEKGEKIAEGRHEELLQTYREYREMVQIQRGGETR
ncbi:thiol reductant ABC exporter subunit CydD [Alkalihalophilus pseudofirmus]|uniref:Thiol reductant ABC exporter subunit CydD n=1 Tax=Alkalihalophilus pseudofirmus TaxID=79885 RepID=A0AAJ2KZT4_ALKPS|nr:thiol reductant ABC exporter subunit CydD [Alkalihalophilus pseudofirmus]MDV2884983.1 thiol reductant ABC exporter subunit CydD [Alkalihalophilus pseudofirmus]